jgi:hydrophobic/amphiphilic exporter-1 (mainly G- bacteria), HAE1 family
MRRIVRLATAHPVSVLALWSVVVVFGTVALFRLPVDLLPVIPLPRIAVVTEYESLPAEEMEQLVTVPVEDALASVSGVRRIESTTKEGISYVELSFDWDADLSVASVEVREQIDRVYPSLPSESNKPIAATRNLGEGALLQVVALPRADRSVAFISGTVSSQVAARLRRISGVGRIQLRGQRHREVQVEVDGSRLRGAGLSLALVTQTVGQSVYELPAGSYVDGSIERLVKITTGVRTVDALRRLPLPVPSGALRLEDIAEVRMGEAAASSLFLSDGREALGLAVYSNPSAGALAVSREVRRTLEELTVEVGREMELRVVSDGADEVRRSIRGLAIAAGIGAAAAGMVLWRAFRSLLPAIVAITALPVSAAGSFLVLYLVDLSVNVISLSGIAIGIGMVVDNNVVVLENIRRRRARTPEEVAVATAEMAGSTFAGTLSTLLVFLPIVFVPGVVGLLFRDLAISVSLLLAFSLPASLTLTPALVTLAGWKGAEPATPAFGQCRAALRHLLETALRRPYLAVVAYGLFVLSGVLLLFGLPWELSPARATTLWELELSLPPGTSVSRVLTAAKELDAWIGSSPGVAERYFYAGYEEDAPLARGGPESGLRYLRGTLVLGEASIEAPVGTGVFGTELPGFPGVSLAPPADSLTAALGAGGERLVEFRAPLRREAEELARRFADRTEGAQMKGSDRLIAHRLILSPDAVAHLGVPASAVLSTLSNAVQGSVPTRLPADGKDTDIRVRLRPRDAGSLRAIESIAIPGAAAHVEVRALGRFEKTRIPETLPRVDRQPVARVAVPFRIAGLEAVVPEGSRVRGINALDEASREVALVFGLALLLIYLLLGAQFESFAAPVGVLAMIPVGAAGALGLLLLLGMTINVASVLGILVLFGTSVNATILLTDAYRRRPGEIVEVTLGRVPAVSITVTTTVVALAPLVFLPLPGGEVQANTGAAVLGGLVTGTLGTLVIYPALYTIGSRCGMRWNRLRQTT